MNSATAVKLKPQSDSDDLVRLRRILLGKEYQELLALKSQLNTPKQHSAKVAEIVSEALELRAKQDNSLSGVLFPTVEGALIESVERDPKRLADALYPVMGPAIRKSINEVLTQTIDTFNQLMEQSLSPRSFLWRFDAWRSGKSYAEVMLLNTLEYQVEQVFFIHIESGLLLRHVASPKAISKDPDMVSGMLTAIQDFIADSFEVEHGDALKHMRLGELTVLVEQGPYAVTAAVVRGNSPAGLFALLRQTSEDIHQQMHYTLQSYEGDSGPFSRIHPLLEKCLLSQTQEEKKRKPWFRYLILGLCLVGLCYMGYQRYQSKSLDHQAAIQDQNWQRLLAVFAEEPGVVIVETQVDGNQRRIQGLVDSLARQPETLLRLFNANSQGQAGIDTRLDFKQYISGESEITEKRARKILQPPMSVQLRVENSVLLISGKADFSWYERLGIVWSLIAGVTEVDAKGLTVMDESNLY